MIPLVVDAGIAVKWYVVEDLQPHALELADQASLFAPSILMAEAANALRKKTRREGLPEQHARDALSELAGADIQYTDVSVLVEPAFELSLMTGCAVYDALYVALARMKHCKFVTADKRLYNNLSNSVVASDILWLSEWRKAGSS